MSLTPPLTSTLCFHGHTFFGVAPSVVQCAEAETEGGGLQPQGVRGEQSAFPPSLCKGQGEEDGEGTGRERLRSLREKRGGGGGGGGEVVEAVEDY